MKIKAKYIVDNNLAGAMFWAIDIDDFNGNHCNQGKSPLLNSVRTYFNENKSTKSSYPIGLPFVTQSPTTNDKYGDMDREELLQELTQEIEYQSSKQQSQNYVEKTDYSKSNYKSSETYSVLNEDSSSPSPKVSSPVEVRDFHFCIFSGWYWNWQ